MNKFKKKIFKIIIAVLLLVTGLIIQAQIDNQWIILAVFLPVYIVAGGHVYLKAIRNIINGQVFDENFLMSIATIGAFLIGEYPEGVGVMLFYQVGELFQGYAVDKSRKSIASLMDIRPDFANVKQGTELIKTNPEEVKTGNTIVIKPGEKVPLDCRITEGDSLVDMSALTGESVPREVCVGDDILSGGINLTAMITAEVTKEYSESTVSKILDLVENAVNKKARTENFITRFAQYYTPIVTILALLISIIPPIVISQTNFSDWIYRGLIFLVVSCPCALVVSIPLSFFGGIGCASREGILVKGSNYLEALAKLDTVVFDKTGTLTKGVFNVQKIYAEDIDENELLEIAAYAENYSNHPISNSLKKAYKKEIDGARVTKTEEIPGHGVCTWIDGKSVSVGNSKLMEKMNIPYKKDLVVGTIVHVAVKGIYSGYIVIADEVKDDARETIQGLKKERIRQTIMLTGDAENVGKQVAKNLQLDKVYAELLPKDKVDKLEELLSEKLNKKTLAYVGDGINDAPVLARADVGIAMGGLGSDAAIEAADVVIMTDEPSKILTGIQISKKTLDIVKQNIVFSLGVKFTVLILAALGFASMWAGVVADVGVTVVAVLNAMRTLRKIN